MKLSRHPIGIVIALVAILSLSLISAGCTSVSVFPTEVNSHGNTIYVDSNYVAPATLAEMLLNPYNYDKELFETIDSYLPKKQPVVEVGVGPGAVMAYVSKKLSVPKHHIAVEANPYLIPDLKKTIEKNALVVDLKNAAVTYNQNNGYVPVTISTDSGDIVTPVETTETVEVPATTITELIEGSAFDTSTNITLIVETLGLLESIFKHDEGLYDHVELIIGHIPEMNDSQIAAFLETAWNAGYELAFVSYSHDSGISSYVFKRVVQNST